MDIKSALQAINDSGMSDAEIAAHISSTQPTVTRLRNGTHKSTSFELGQKIMELFRQVNRKKAAA